jgi:hypothetical protein
MHRAGAAKGSAATELTAGQSNFVPEIPQQRHIRVAIELTADTIDLQGNHLCSPCFACSLILSNYYFFIACDYS